MNTQERGAGRAVNTQERGARRAVNTQEMRWGWGEQERG